MNTRIDIYPEEMENENTLFKDLKHGLISKEEYNQFTKNIQNFENKEMFNEKEGFDENMCRMEKEF